MARATRQEIEEWKENGKARGATHLLIVRDQEEDDDYPIFVMPGQDPQEIKADYNNIEDTWVKELIRL